MSGDDLVVTASSGQHTLEMEKAALYRMIDDERWMEYRKTTKRERNAGYMIPDDSPMDDKDSPTVGSE